MTHAETAINQRLADELTASQAQVIAAVELLDGGATVPFIARYRKEQTGGLDDGQLRRLEERLGYLRELEDRRRVVLESIDSQGKLDPQLRADILAAETRTRLEDLYLPYRPKRRTRGQIALEAGLGPLAETLLTGSGVDPQALAQSYLNTEAGIGDTKAALDGARYILMERFAESADLLQALRERLRADGAVFSVVVPGKEQEGAKFRDYFDYREPLHAIPSHRALALLRGRREGLLTLQLDLPDQDPALPHACEGMITHTLGLNAAPGSWLADTVRWTWRVKLQGHLETELLGELRERAEAEAIDVFARNLRDLLLAAPAGARPCIGLDPGLRTGVKVAVLDGTGKLLESTALYPHAPQKRWDEAIAWLAAAAARHGSELIAIGNGTASRETERLAAELIRRHPELGLTRVVVSEAGASVYSASELAAAELPGVDVTIRGAVSIARRLQDPLAELVKIDPRSIGVGQYQHDVSQLHLARRLDAVVEDCVNAVGVELNTASAALLGRVAGLSSSLAAAVVARRDSQGPFRSRAELLEVTRLGPRAFEQCAGFLRIRDGANPLDASAVHPERYALVDRIAADCGTPVDQLIGNRDRLAAIDPARYVSDEVGLPTVTDILGELDKPGRDPRPEFHTAQFKDGVETLADLKPDMILEGVVTNVTNFGAFVDIGVHQDGLVHISALADRFVKNPHDVVRAGEVVKVRVLEVDLERQRIALSRRLERSSDDPATREPRGRSGWERGAGDHREGPKSHPRKSRDRTQRQPAPNTTLAAAFQSARDKQR